MCAVRGGPVGARGSAVRIRNHERTSNSGHSETWARTLRCSPQAEYCQISCRHPPSSSDGTLTQHSSRSNASSRRVRDWSRDIRTSINCRRISAMHFVDRVLQRSLGSSATAACMSYARLFPHIPHFCSRSGYRPDLLHSWHADQNGGGGVVA